jgi:hypothetical protein
MRRVVVLLATLVLLGSFTPSASAQPEPAGVIAVEDISFSSDCFITSRELDESGTTVLSETTEACPAGTVLHSFPTNEADALNRGLAYVYVTGEAESDQAAVADLKAAQLPTAAPSADTPQDRALACSYRRYSKTYSYAIRSRNSARVSGTVDYAQDEDCYGRLYSVKDSFAGSPAVYWDSHHYQYPVNPPQSRLGAGCGSLGTRTASSNAADGSFGWKISLGGY